MAKGDFFNKSNIPGLRDGSFEPRIEVKLFGKWDDTLKMIGKLDPAIKLASTKAQLKVCNVIKVKLKAHLRNQDLGWRELSEHYAERKGKAEMDPRTLIAAAGYYWAIDVWEIKSRFMVFVGVKKGIYSSFGGKRNKLEIARVAAIHEFSSGKRIPKRPLWNPTIAEIGGGKGIQKMYINSLIHWLQQSGIKLDNKITKIKDIPGGLK